MHAPVTKRGAVIASCDVPTTPRQAKATIGTANRIVIALKPLRSSGRHSSSGPNSPPRYMAVSAQAALAGDMPAEFTMVGT